MNALEHVRSMWGAKVKRSTKLIVPSVTQDGSEGSLNNELWAFRVPYVFRDALDIKYEERRKNKTPYMVWTQGPILRFKEGDLIYSNDNCRAVQIRFASPMGWDAQKEEMYQGSVAYSEYVVSSGNFSKLKEQECTQMQFLELLMLGKYE